MYYSYAKLAGIDFGFFRFPGMGLGNLLFPWARFIVAARKYDLVPIYPTWFQIKIGQMLRNETDKRFYHGLFYNSGDYIDGLKKLYLLNTLKKIKETDFYELIREKQVIRQNAIMVFEGMDGHFNQILKDHGLILSELLKMTREQHKKGFTELRRQTIGVHVRRGDFSKPQSRDVLETGGVNYRIPLSWYACQIEQIRRVVGSHVLVNIFSDGTDEELSELLALRHVKKTSFGSSIADLLALSRSGVLVASGSTFSMWASYLGRMPVVWHKGQLKQKLYYENEGVEIECDDHSKLPLSFLDILSTRFSNACKSQPSLSCS